MNKRIFISLVSLWALVLILAFGCEVPSQGEADPASQGPAATGTAALSTQAAGTQQGTELARIGDTVITAEQFDARLEGIPPIYRRRMATTEGKREFLDRMVQQELYYQEALRRGLDQDPEYVEQMQQYTRTFLASRVRKDVLQQDVTPTEEEMLAYYEENREEFLVPESLELRHILIKVSRRATEEEIETARSKADEARAAIRSGRPFEEVAQEYSEDRYSAQRGGEIPAVRRGVKSNEFDEAAWALSEESSLSEVFRDRRGFNILRYVGRNDASYREFEDVSTQIRRKLENENRRNLLADFDERLRTETNVVIHEELLEELGPTEEELNGERVSPRTGPISPPTRTESRTPTAAETGEPGEGQ